MHKLCTCALLSPAASMRCSHGLSQALVSLLLGPQASIPVSGLSPLPAVEGSARAAALASPAVVSAVPAAWLASPPLMHHFSNSCSHVGVLASAAVATTGTVAQCVPAPSLASPVALGTPPRLREPPSLAGGAAAWRAQQPQAQTRAVRPPARRPSLACAPPDPSVRVTWCAGSHSGTQCTRTGQRG